MKIKRFAAAALALMLALFSTGAFAATDEEYEAQIADLKAQIAQLEHDLAAKDYVAEFDGGFVLATDAMEQYEYVEYMYSYYGYSMDGYEDYIKQDLAKSMVQDAIVQYEAKAMGLDQYTDEQKAEITANADASLANYIANYRSNFEGEDKTEEDIIAETTDYLTQNGISYESLYTQEEENYLSNLLFAKVVEDVSISEDDAKAKFDALVAADETTYQSASDYENAALNGTAIYWRPEGYRNVKQVLVAFDDDQSSRYSDINSRLTSLQSELDALNAPAETAEAEATEAAESAEPTAEPRSAEEIQADIDAANAELDALYAELMPKAEEVTGKFAEGTGIDELIATYGGDPGSINEDGTTNTYQVSAASASYDSAFVDAAMSVSAIGEMSQPTRGSYGLYIVYYDSDVTSGAVDYETVKDDVYQLALDEAQTTTYNAQMDAWMEELNVVYYLENFR